MIKSAVLVVATIIAAVSGCGEKKESISVTIDFDKGFIRSNNPKYFIDSICLKNYQQSAPLFALKRLTGSTNLQRNVVKLAERDDYHFSYSGSFEGACKFNDLEIHVFLRNSYSATVETAYAATYFICDKDSSVVIEVEGLL